MSFQLKRHVKDAKHIYQVKSHFGTICSWRFGLGFEHFGSRIENVIYEYPPSPLIEKTSMTDAGTVALYRWGTW